MAGQLSRIGTTPSNMYPQLTLLWRNEKKKKKKKKKKKMVKNRFGSNNILFFQLMDVDFTTYNVSGLDGKLKAYTCHFLNYTTMNNTYVYGRYCFI